MSGSKEIRTKISSVKNTRKITSAMEMVAASKMRKAQERMFAARPYSDAMLHLISHIAGANSEYKNPLMEVRTEKTQSFIVVSSDRGLCGGLNANLLKFLLEKIDSQMNQKFLTVGSKATAFVNRFAKVQASATQLGDRPKIQDLIGLTKIAIDDFYCKKNRCYLPCL